MWQRGWKLKRKGVWWEAEIDGGTGGTTQWGRHRKGQRNHQCTNATRDDGYGYTRASYICRISMQLTNAMRDNSPFPVAGRRNRIQGGTVMAWDGPTEQTEMQQQKTRRVQHKWQWHVESRREGRERKSGKECDCRCRCQCQAQLGEWARGQLEWKGGGGQDGRGGEAAMRMMRTMTTMQSNFIKKIKLHYMAIQLQLMLCRGSHATAR